ncbi:MAG: glycoside hydrolase family 32 protein [Melioribacteraceae bacterium]|nr:glycoside hydrolase family 32 protein [Melioribacteraceae bacterium]
MSDYYQEKYRPQFHFSPEKNWMNDPNGMFYYEGEYHLFYQHNPFGNIWGHMSWGHAVSPDLIHWKHLPLALIEENGIMIFSGCAVVDWNNSSGFGRDEKPPIVAIYTGRVNETDIQFQCIAYSNNKGRTFTKYALNPVINLNSQNFRDPKVFWYEPEEKWVMIVSLPDKRKVQLYESTNLIDWSLMSDFGSVGSIKGIWECPDLFPLFVDDNKNNEKWVLTVNVISNSISGGSGAQYFIGIFDGQKFILDQDYHKSIVMVGNKNGIVAEIVDNRNMCKCGNIGSPPRQSSLENALWVDYGHDFYAPVTWSDIPKDDGRKLWLGWMSNWDYAQDVPTSPWRSSMSIPRELKLKNTENGIRLFQTPVKEFKNQRINNIELYGNISSINKELKQKKFPGAIELLTEININHNQSFGLSVLKGKEEETKILFNGSKKTIGIDRSKSGEIGFNNLFSKRELHYAPLKINGQIKLHIFIDANSIELFVNDGKLVFTDLVFHSEHSTSIEFFGAEESIEILKLNLWSIKSIWD